MNVQMKTLLSGAMIFCGLFAAVNSAFAQTWIQQTNAPSLDWLSVASSADGHLLIAGGYSALYTSTNAGAAWTSNSVPVHDWACVASSADGNKLAAGVGFLDTGLIYLSTNTGTTWTTSGAPSKAWSSLSMSADGTKLIAAVNGGPVYVSSDSGTTWTSNSVSINHPFRVASSADGTKLAVASSSGGAVFTSTNSGVFWTSNSTGAPILDGPCLASSADGSILIVGAGGNGGLIYKSTNSGMSWTSNSIHKVWASVAAAADGRQIISGCYPAIYTSTDSGATWISNNAPNLSWSAVATSADGNKLVAAAFPGGIYTCQTTPSPLINLTLTNGNSMFSWIVPSTNFVLQQNLDLTTTNWVTLTNEPTLNLTNLNDEVVLPQTNSSGLFRLMAQ
jgi:hypothetical protein